MYSYTHLYICMFTRPRWHYAHTSILVWGFAFALVAHAWKGEQLLVPRALARVSNAAQDPDVKSDTCLVAELGLQRAHRWMLAQQKARATLCVCC